MREVLRFFLAFLLSFSALSNLNATPLKVDTFHYNFAEDSVPLRHDMKLPFVSSKSAEVSKKINDYLFIDLLRIPAPKNIHQKLNNVSQQAIWSLDSQTYQVIRNDGNLLSIDSTVEYCAAYCETARVRYNFDATSGRHIGLLDLLTPQGIVDLAKVVHMEREQRIQQELKSIKNADITYTKDPNDIEDAMTPESVGDVMTSIYKDCLKNDAGVFELESFLMENNKVTFYRQTCAPHVIQAGDSIGEFSNVFSFKALTPYLSEYGKKLLFKKNTNQANLGNIFNKVLYGKIGQHKVIMLLNSLNEDNSFSGVYFYQTEKKSIELSGELLNGEFTLREEAGEIKAKLVNGMLVGEWHGSETLKFEAAP